MIEGKAQQYTKGKLTYGMIGGGQGAFIGEVHRKAAEFDNKANLVCGCFSRNYDNTFKTGISLGIQEERLYVSYEEMAQVEGTRDEKIDFAVIVTPNYAHYKIAKTFLENGIPVVCEKPLCFSVEEAEDLEKIAKKNDLLICVTYGYSGYPMLKQAREMVKNGDIGEIRVVMGEYPQDWLASELEKTGQKQAAWRTDPKLAGISNCVGDIGSHIEHTVSYITGLDIESLCATLQIFGEDRQLDTNGEVMLKYTNGATGMYWCSQIAIGHDNGLKIRVYGTKGSIEWEQEKCNYLKVAFQGQPVQTLSRGCGYLYPSASNLSRIPAGHPEGYYESFTNVYNAFLNALQMKKDGKVINVMDYDYPKVSEGIQGVKFINKCVESSNNQSTWIKF